MNVPTGLAVPAAMLRQYSYHGSYVPTPSSPYWTGGAIAATIVILGLLATGAYLVVKHRNGTYASSDERERRSREARARQVEKARAARLRHERRKARRGRPSEPTLVDAPAVGGDARRSTPHAPVQSKSQSTESS